MALPSLQVSCELHFTTLCRATRWGYWRQRADERLSNPPYDKRESLMVNYKVGRPQVSLGSAGPWNVIRSPVIALTLLIR